MRAERLIGMLDRDRHVEQGYKPWRTKIFFSLRLTNTATWPVRLAGWSAARVLGATTGLGGSVTSGAGLTKSPAGAASTGAGVASAGRAGAMGCGASTDLRKSPGASCAGASAGCDGATVPVAVSSLVVTSIGCIDSAALTSSAGFAASAFSNCSTGPVALSSTLLSSTLLSSTLLSSTLPSSTLPSATLASSGAATASVAAFGTSDAASAPCPASVAVASWSSLGHPDRPRQAQPVGHAIHRNLGIRLWLGHEQAGMHEIDRRDFVPGDDHPCAEPCRRPEPRRKFTRQADAAVRSRNAGQHALMHRDARPGQALHEEHRRVVVDVRAVKAVLLDDAEHAHRGRMAGRAGRNRCLHHAHAIAENRHALGGECDIDLHHALWEFGKSHFLGIRFLDRRGWCGVHEISRPPLGFRGSHRAGKQGQSNAGGQRSAQQALTIGYGRGCPHEFRQGTLRNVGRVLPVKAALNSKFYIQNKR